MVDRFYHHRPLQKLHCSFAVASALVQEPTGSFAEERLDLADHLKLQFSRYEDRYTISGCTLLTERRNSL